MGLDGTRILARICKTLSDHHVLFQCLDRLSWYDSMVLADFWKNNDEDENEDVECIFYVAQQFTLLFQVTQTSLK